VALRPSNAKRLYMNDFFFFR